MKVGTRLAIGYALVLCLMLAIVATGLLKMREMNERTRTITEVNNVQIALIATMQDTVTDRMIALRNLILFTTSEQMQPETKRIATQEALYTEAFAKLQKTFEGPETTQEEKAFAVKLQELSSKAAPLMAKSMELGLANKAEEGTDYLINQLRPVQREWLATLSDLVAFEDKLNARAAANAQAAYDGAVKLMLMLGGIALALGVASATTITRGLLRQLGGEPNDAAAIATEIANGNLTVDVPVKPGDQSSMLYAMRTMRDRLAAIVTEVRTGTDTIATASGQISAGNADLSSRTEEQASSLEETASSMEELTSTVRQNADNAQQASAMAASASEVAAKGGQVVAQVVDTMGAINESARKIVDIISVIDGIAFQTNILALNAAVEAARAGEQGRGFAVVAGEVRNLAHRAGTAAKEIKALIDDSVHKVDEGSQLVGQAGATMEEIVGSVQRVTDIMSEISAASREQSSGIDQVNQAIAQMDQVTQQNAALVEEASAASESMQDQAAKLAQLVGTFTVPQSAAGPAPVAAVAARVVAAKPARPLVQGPAPAAAPVKPAKAKAAPQPSRKVAATAESEWEEF
ncbi:methyl-accepting chemotaxis protein [Pseudoduganella plicata]|uniref:Methyl-accepting chemotaxis protein n=1 Tax=Pseudoduganella plicata TaxID=321984 RepID=A0A4P7BEB5_9BURK|nr:methyl-accepting chemotaxis protein [Pseudoduganella plicata]QBQ36590.1 methyl-accepting chemotaxis protein [Pseudoduganella plicata]GGY74159.1 methyl-accepting chemotaxis protein [Pseudoduganella plicata]